MAYLGHVISGEGVLMDKGKISAMLSWKIPSNLEVAGLLWSHGVLLEVYQGVCFNCKVVDEAT